MPVTLPAGTTGVVPLTPSRFGPWIGPQLGWGLSTVSGGHGNIAGVPDAGYLVVSADGASATVTLPVTAPAGPAYCTAYPQNNLEFLGSFTISAPESSSGSSSGSSQSSVSSDSSASSDVSSSSSTSGNSTSSQGSASSLASGGSSAGSSGNSGSSGSSGSSASSGSSGSGSSQSSLGSSGSSSSNIPCPPCLPLDIPAISEVNFAGFVVTAPSDIPYGTLLQLQVSLDGGTEWFDAGDPVEANEVVTVNELDPSKKIKPMTGYWVRWAQVQ